MSKPARTTIEFPGLVLDPRDPLAIARRYIADRFTVAGRRTLHAHRGDLRLHTGTYYRVVEPAAARAGIYGYLESARRPAKKEGSEPFRPTQTNVNHVLDALEAAAHLDEGVQAPAWLCKGHGVDPAELIACANGLLHVPSRKLIPHTQDFYCTHALPYAYERNAGEPVELLRFLRSLWPSDPEQIEVLQEIVGYVISGETRQQKCFIFVGPRRSGKGTIARLLRALFGLVNVAGPTLSSLATNFGLQGLIDKPLAIVSDARLSGRADQAVIVERLLSISGEDVLSVDRKHRDPWVGQLPTRFLILTNEIPRLPDTSGALGSRFIALRMTESFYGREDTTLLDRLLPEMPAILTWALDGLDRLQARGRFVRPTSSENMVQEMEDLASPVGAFVRDCCIVESGAEIPIPELHAAWTRWCRDRGQEHVSTADVFGRDLRAVVPGIATGSRRSGFDRWRAFVGIRLGGGL